MIRYALHIEPDPIQPGLDYRDGIVCTGSCFTDHIASRLKSSGFSVYAQSNGVVFNPVSLADPFERMFGEGDYTDHDLLHHNGLWHSKFHHGSFSEPGKADTLRKANHHLHELKRQLHAARWLFITFGSAWVYTYRETGEIVANCHKIPQEKFAKSLLTTDVVSSTWLSLIPALKQFNPHLNIVFTISPVKHLRDGVTENHMSKSVLFLALRGIMEAFPETRYFPAFELVNDDLRDYRFYESDGAHPAPLAIDYVYERFKTTLFNPETMAYSADVEKYLQMSRHRILREDGEEYVHFMRQLELTREGLLEKYGLEL